MITTKLHVQNRVNYAFLRTHYAGETIRVSAVKRARIQYRRWRVLNERIVHSGRIKWSLTIDVYPRNVIGVFGVF